MKEAVFQELRETRKAVMNGSWMGWRDQSFKNIQLLYPDSPVFSLAENIKDAMVVVWILTIVTFLLISPIEVFLPHLLPLEPFSPNFSNSFSACTHN